MTDFQNWWDGYFHEINGQKETAQAAWLARGELDAVRIKELEAKFENEQKDCTKECDMYIATKKQMDYEKNLSSAQAEITSLKAKLDAAKDFFKTMENNTYSFVSVYQMLSKNALEELDK